MGNNLYFIADSERRFVKIGLSRNPEKRLWDLQAGSPIQLEIVLIVPDLARHEEESLHQHFARHWSHREWFVFAPEIAALIEQLADGAELMSLIPPARFPNGIAWEMGGLSTKAETMAVLRDGAR